MIKRLLIAAVLSTATLNLMAQNDNKAKTEKKEKTSKEKRNIKLKQEYSTPSGLKYKLLEMGSGKKSYCRRYGNRSLYRHPA